MADPESVALRIYAVRLACGDGVRKAESMRAFVERIERITGVTVYASRLSDLENGKASPSLEEGAVIMAVDPKQRGVDWLAGAQTAHAPPRRAIEEDEEDEDRTDRAAAEERQRRQRGAAAKKRRDA